jgi:hypothetical protein
MTGRKTKSPSPAGGGGWGFLVLAATALAVLLLGLATWGMAASSEAQSAVAAGPATSPVRSSVAAGIVNLHMSNTPYGPPVTQFPEGTSIVYVVFDYYDTANTPIQVVIYPPSGPPAIFDQTQTYSGNGTASVSVPGSFPPDPPPAAPYVTNVYVAGQYADGVQWRVAGSAGTPTPTPTTSPGTICALVYEDVNGNQTRDFGESLLAGAVITLTDANRVPLYTYTTDGMHEPHCFPPLAPSDYYVLEKNPPNYSSTTGDTMLLTVASGTTMQAAFGDRIPFIPTETPTLTATPCRLFLPLILKSFRP